MQKYYPVEPGLVVTIVLLFTIFLAAPGCLSKGGDETTGTIRVAVTIPPQEEMVREIGGDHVEIFVMVPPGSDPHTYEPRPALVTKAAEADIYLTLGRGLLPVEDVLASRFRDMNPDLVIVESSQGIIYLRNSEGTEESNIRSYSTEPVEPDSHGKASPDPHIWLSLRNAEIMSENTRDALIMADPAHEKEYRENCDRYTARLKDLDRTITDAFSRNNPGIILVTHPAWEYFARDYDLTMVAIEHEGKEPTAKDLEALIILARTHGVRVVFAEAQESTREAETIAREIGGTVRVIDPLAGDYLASMERVSQAFMEAGAG